MDPKRYTAAASARAPDETELVERFRERVRVLATRRLGDAAAAEDVAQEALARVVEALRAGKVENFAALPAYIFQTARHLCLQHHRSSGRGSRALHRLHADGSAGNPAGPDPLSALVTEQRRDQVRSALDRLRPGDRELLRMLYHDEAGTADVASHMATTAAAVRVRKHRALRRLGELLDEADF